MTEATSSVMAGAVGGEAGASIGTAGGATLGGSSLHSVVLTSWAMLFSTGASASGALCKVSITVRYAFSTHFVTLLFLSASLPLFLTLSFGLSLSISSSPNPNML